MSAIDRCTCTPHYQDAGAGLTEYVPEWDPSCSEHGEIDHILASCRYTDRRGRPWKVEPSPRDGIWWGTPHDDEFMLVMRNDKMRLLIERDMHRDVCEGLGFCLEHPVPSVITSVPRVFEVFGVRNSSATHADLLAPTLPEAMDAARALAVGP